MRKKVLIINGSSRKRNTYNILLQIGKILKAQGLEVEILNLFEYQISDCIGCQICVTQKDCYIADDMPLVKQKVLESDGVVFGSPVYMGGVTSKFKTFADRTNVWFHKPETAGKPMMFVSTAMSTGLKETKKFFRTFATGLGARKGEFIGRSEKTMNKPVKKKELSRFLKLLGNDKSCYRPSLNEIVMFNVGKVLANKSISDDKLFWRQKKWLGKLYYYPCKLNFFKKLFSKFMFGVLTKSMK